MINISKEDFKEADSKVGIVEICSLTTEDGKDFYAYISIKPSKYEEYRRVNENRETVDLNEYGRILYKDWGKGPSADVRRMMEEKYNVNHNFEAEFTQELQKIEKERKE